MSEFLSAHKHRISTIETVHQGKWGEKKGENGDFCNDAMKFYLINETEPMILVRVVVERLTHR